MIFRLTQKLARKIKVEPVDARPPHENPLLDWTANLFMVSRRQCILLTNSRTLYSVVFRGKGVSDEKTFVGQSMTALDQCLTHDGILGLYDAEMEPALGSPEFCKASDRSVLSSMNQLVFYAKCDLLKIGHPLPVVNRRLNRIPMSKLEYRYAFDALLALGGRSRT